MYISDNIFGFKLNKIKPIKEIDGKLYVFEHIKTGLELIWIRREDENKTFSISFKTTPTDDTGVFHILEHSVLCGSKKYPVKDPFVRLLQTSMQTFLNAMTYPDKTVYPISSRNDKDFMNLMDVYLDAVFNPAFLEKPYAFLQEGWHFEGDENGNPMVQGVVFSEMQGVFASVDAKIEMALNRKLFSDTCYKYVYGGYPQSIVDLSYDNFIETYKKYYHPSNAVIQLDGSVDIEKILEYIDSQYLSAFDKRENEIIIEKQRVFAPDVSVCPFDIAENENDGRKNILVLSRVFADYCDIEQASAVQLICDYLCSSNEAPLKRAILDSGLADDIKFSVNTEGRQSQLVIMAENCKADDFAEIRKIVMTTIKSAAQNGFDKDELKAHLNQMIFALNEPSQHYGLELMTSILQSRFYGGEPELYLEHNAVTDALKKAIHTDYFERLALEVFNDTDFYEIQMLAESGLAEKENAAFNEKITGILNSMTDGEFEENQMDVSGLYSWQDTPDSEQALALLPVLTLDDVDKKPVVITANEKAVNGIRVLEVPVQNPSITYLRFYFELSDAVEDKMFELSFLTNLLTNLPTKNYSVSALQRELNLYLGNISFDILPITDDSPDKCRVYLVIACSCLNENVNKAFELVKEIILNTQFDDFDKIKEISVQIKNIMKEMISSQGNKYAAYRALSSVSAAGSVTEQTMGWSCYEKLKNLPDNLSETFRMIITDTFAENRLTLGYCGNVSKESIASFNDFLPNGNVFNPYIKANLCSENEEGIKITGNVAYAVLADNLKNCSADFGSASLVASHYLSYEYLWNEIRVQNGAYGAGLQVKANGDIIFNSYRDPNPENSLSVYKNAGEFLRNTAISDEELASVKIGTISDIESLLTASQRCKSACDNALCNMDYEYHAKLKQGIIDLSVHDFIIFSEVLDKMAKQGSICVIGENSLLSECEISSVKEL